MIFGKSIDDNIRYRLQDIWDLKDLIPFRLKLSKKLIIAITLFFYSSLAYPATIDVKVETTGYGETYREALLNALLDAVGQVRGLQTSTKEFLNLEFQQMVHDDVMPITIQTISEEERVSTRVKGWLKSYRVLSSGKDSKAGHWVVEISAVVPKPENERLKDSRKTLAVMPFRIPSVTFNIGNSYGESIKVPAVSVSMRMADQLRANFSQIGKFSVINRQFGPEVLSEKALLGSELVPPSEAANLGSVIGADLMLLGKIYRFETETRDKKFYNSTDTIIKDRIELYYQIVDAHTQKILWANTIDFYFDKEKQQTLAEQLADDEEYSSLTDTLNALSVLISGEVLSHIYPPKVISVKGKSIIISHGGKALGLGNILKIYGAGKTVKDPDTGRPLVIDGEMLGEIEITDLRPEYAIGTLVKGDIGKVNVKVVLRGKARESQATQQTEEKRYSTPGDSDAPVSW